MSRCQKLSRASVERKSSKREEQTRRVHVHLGGRKGRLNRIKCFARPFFDDREQSSECWRRLLKVLRPNSDSAAVCSVASSECEEAGGAKATKGKAKSENRTEGSFVWHGPPRATRRKSDSCHYRSRLRRYPENSSSNRKSLGDMRDSFAVTVLNCNAVPPIQRKTK